MKKILFIAGISLLLSLKISGNLEEIEQAIFNSRPENLEKLLSEVTLTDQQIKNFGILAVERHKMRTSDWREKPKPGEPFIKAGVISLVLGAPVLLTSLLDHFSQTRSQVKIFNPLPIIASILLTISAGSFYLAYRENKKPGWRSKEDEQWDASKVKTILLNFIQKNHKALVKQ